MMRSRRVWMLALTALALVLAGCSRMAPGSWPGVSVGDDTVWVAYQQQVFAVALENGGQRWAFPVEPDSKRTFFAAPQLTADRTALIVGGYDGVLYALDPANGQERWSFTAAQDRYIGAALVTPDFIYAPNADGTLYALDLEGRPVWTFATQAALWAPPVTDGETLFVSSLDHHLYALDARTGQERWRAALDGALPASPTLVDGVLYVGELANEVTALNAADGSVRWTAPVAAWVWHSPVPLGDDALVVGDMEGHVYALTRAEGRVRWQAQVDGAIIGAPLVADGTVFVTTRAGMLAALDAANGQVRWQKPLVEDGTIEAGPVLTPEGLLLVAPSDAKAPLLAVQPDGTVVWTFSLEK